MILFNDYFILFWWFRSHEWRPLLRIIQLMITNHENDIVNVQLDCKRDIFRFSRPSSCHTGTIRSEPCFLLNEVGTSRLFESIWFSFIALEPLYYEELVHLLKTMSIYKWETIWEFDELGALISARCVSTFVCSIRFLEFDSRSHWVWPSCGQAGELHLED